MEEQKTEDYKERLQKVRQRRNGKDPMHWFMIGGCAVIVVLALVIIVKLAQGGTFGGSGNARVASASEAEVQETVIGETLPEDEEQSADRERLIPNTEIFKEIMVELIKNQQIDIRALRKERSEYIREKADSFQLNEMLLDLADRQSDPIQRIEVYRLEDGKVIEFGRVKSEDGRIKRVACSNVLLRVIREDR